MLFSKMTQINQDCPTSRHDLCELLFLIAILGLFRRGQKISSAKNVIERKKELQEKIEHTKRGLNF